MALPLALNVAGVPLPVSPVISTDVRSSLASAICEATARFQIRSYTRISSLSRMRSSDAGVRRKSVGRIASCASCALRTLVWYCRGPLWKSAPYNSTTACSASTSALLLSVVESVR